MIIFLVISMRYLLLFLFLSACATKQPEQLPPLTEGIPVYRNDDSQKNSYGAVDMGNQGRVVYVAVPLILPPKPNIPKIKGSDMTCLNPTTQWELKNRDTIMKDYISELETIIKSTQK